MCESQTRLIIKTLSKRSRSIIFVDRVLPCEHALFLDFYCSNAALLGVLCECHVLFHSHFL
jgi:hypothetical protein